MDGSYVALQIPRGGAVTAIARLRSENFTGCNVTYPLKEEAVAACDALAEEARRAKAVNTIYFGTQTIGTNTDGIGARSAIEAHLDEPIALARIGVLGYGATARAILAELHDNDAYAYVWGRSEERVRDVCARYEAAQWPVSNPPEIVVSTLPPDAEVPPELIVNLKAADVVFDANYGARATLARTLGREVVPGSAMLEAQARASFDFWLAHVTGVA